MVKITEFFSLKDLIHIYYIEVNDCLDIPILSEKISELAAKQAKIKVTLFFKYIFQRFRLIILFNF